MRTLKGTFILAPLDHSKRIEFFSEKHFLPSNPSTLLRSDATSCSFTKIYVLRLRGDF